MRINPDSPAPGGGEGQPPPAVDQRLVDSRRLEVLGLLAGTIAHDFKNVLAAVLANAEMADTALAEGGSPAEYLGSIREAGRRGVNLCRQLLAYSGRARFVVGRTDLTELTRGGEEFLRVSLRDRPGVRLEFDLADGLPTVLADATQVQQILLNFVLNGADAVGAAEGTVRVRTAGAELSEAELREAVVGRDAAPGRYVILEVTDTGSGMSGETRRKIFEPFYTTKPTGRGLGMVIVPDAMRSHGGGVFIDTRPGRGTTMRLFFPTCESVESDEPVPVPRGPDSDVRLSGETDFAGDVLVIDDDETISLVLGKMLGTFGLAASLANDGGDGLALLLAPGAAYRLVVLDWSMPGVSGEEAFRDIRRSRPGMPIVVMSAYSEEEVRGKLGDVGRVAFLSKPFDRGSIRAALEELLPGGEGGES